MKLVLGITGAPLAGKGTVAERIETLFKNDGFTVNRHRFSDILRETLDLWGLPHGRENEQRMAQLMIQMQSGTLSRAMRARLEKDSADVGMLDGVRWFSDEEMIRSFGERGIANAIIYVAADEKTRYERLIKRNRAGEAETTFGEFERQGKAENEIYIPEIGSRADLIIKNNYADPGDLYRDVEKGYREKIKPFLTR